MEPGDYVAIRTDFVLGGPAALLNGRLVEADGCLWVAGDDGGRYLPAWGRGTRAYGVSDGPPVVVEIDGRKIIAGSWVSLGGGELKDIGTVERVLEAPIPSACRAGPFWWVTSLEATR